MEMRYFIGVLKNNPYRAYDFICENYYKMSKEELKDIAKELLYVIHAVTNEEEHNKMLNYVAIELEDFYAEY